ncbi:hypothetical protein LZ554_007390 [Drepanopeziza brunnea f. sp. 'monogermtubi']|nr:hypothetical protein LZ554_007390 [Drepanopeziza brunnea f. sp. 'monogermtubi']
MDPQELMSSRAIDGLFRKESPAHSFRKARLLRHSKGKKVLPSHRVPETYISFERFDPLHQNLAEPSGPLALIRTMIFTFSKKGKVPLGSGSWQLAAGEQIEMLRRAQELGDAAHQPHLAGKHGREATRVFEPGVERRW